MRGIEQRAIGAVIDVEFLAPALLDAHDQARIFRAQRAAGLAPQFGVVGDRKRVEVLVDQREIVFERRRFEAGIDARKAAADIDHVDHDRGLGDRRAGAVQRLDEGEGRHRLAADMEAHAQPVRILARLAQQQRRLRQVAAEFRREREFGIFAGNAQADAQAQIARCHTVIAAGRFDDLCQLFRRIEAERAHAVIEIRLTDRAGGLDGVHEAQRGIGQQAAHEPHFGDRGDVVMRHAAIPQHADQVGRGIGLHRIERLAGKFLDEEPRRARRSVGAVQNDGLVRRKGANYCLGVREMLQFKGPPKQPFRAMKRQAALRLGRVLGAAGAARI